MPVGPVAPLAADISTEMSVLIRAARSGGATRSGAVIVPAHLVEWARQVLKNAKPAEMKALDEAIKANFSEV